MPCFCDFCGWNPTSHPESQITSNNGIELHERNIEPITSSTEALLNILHVPEPEIIEENPSSPVVFYDLNNSAYDMKGDNLHYVFYHESYKNTSHFKRPPSRNGTRDDAGMLVEALELHGFRFRIYCDMKFEQIIDIISRVSQQSHTRTSCLCVTIMTHATSNALLAADRPYRLSQIEILLQSDNLAGIPKILILPCIRGGREMPGVINGLPPQDESASWALPCNAVMDICCGCVNMSHQFYTHFFKKECTVCTVCGARNADSGVTVQCAAGNTTVLPRTADFAFIHAANNDLMSLSILIQSICEVFQEHDELELGDMLPILNLKVANKTDPAAVVIIPETRITLTKTLRFTRTVPRRT